MNFDYSIENRAIRVFISSTFRDMMDERDHLMKVTFPEIRKYCRERNVEFTEIDLRWGVTDEEAKEGKVIKICLDEIDKSRPFFIGILGERYGWVPLAEDYEKHKMIIEDHGWVGEDIQNGLSITEMEVQYGVLRNPAMKGHAYFYLRNEGHAPDSPDFKEVADSPEQNKLTRLREKLADQHEFPVSAFSTPEELGNQIREDLFTLVDFLFPKADIPDPLSRQRSEHELFLKNRLSNYIPFPEYFQAIDDHVKSNQGPLVISGKPGSGKSALIANWIHQFRKDNPDKPVIFHFVGGASDSTSYTQILRRLCGEIIRQANLNVSIPDDPSKLPQAFEELLSKTSPDQEIIIVVDALNQLDVSDNAHLLNWFPESFPQHVRVLLSVLPGDSAQVLERRGYQFLEVLPLNQESSVTLINAYLKAYSKSLDPALANTIASSNLARNPLTLRSLLEELRIFGQHEKLSDHIEHYTSRADYNAFFNAILQRMESDYEQENTGLVGKILSLIYTSRNGLSETEILEICDIPPLHWSPIHLALENHLINRNGILDFNHDFMRKAVKERYISSDEILKTLAKEIAVYLIKHDQNNDRRYNELPYQLNQAEMWEDLYLNLSFIDVFLAIYDRDPYELIKYWRNLVPDYNPVEIYDIALNSFDNHTPDKERVANAYGMVGILMTNLGRWKDAEPYYKKYLEITQHHFGENHPNTLSATSILASLYEDMGQYPDAEKLLEKTLELQQVSGVQSDDLALTLQLLASVKVSLGQFGDAEKLYKQTLHIREEIFGKEHLATANCRNDLARLFDLTNRFAEAETMFKETIDLKIKLLGNDHPETLAVVNNLAELYRKQGRYPEAEELYLKILNIRTEVLGEEHTSTSKTMNNLGTLYLETREFDKAKKYYEKCLVVRESLFGKMHPETAAIIGNLGNLFQNTGELEKAESNYKEALEINEKLYGVNHSGLISIVNNLGSLYQDLGNQERAIEFYNRALELARKTYGENHADVALSLNNLGMLHLQNGNLDEAGKLFNHALEMIQNLGGYEHLQFKLLVNVANLHFQQNKFSEAENILVQSLEICDKIFGPDHVHTVYTFYMLGEVYEAMEAYPKAIESFQKVSDGLKDIHGPDPEKFMRACLKQAAINQQLNQVDEAEKVLTGLVQMIPDDKNFYPPLDVALHELSEIYRTQGQNEKTISTYKKLIPIREALYGEAHAKTGLICFLLGNEYYQLKDVDRTEMCYLKALKTEGHDDLSMVIMKNSLGWVYHMKQEPEKAEQFYLEALDFSKQKLGVDAPPTDKCLGELAGFYIDQNNFEKCRDLNLELAEIRTRTRGANHPSTVTTLIHVALTQKILEEHSDAMQTLNRILQVYQEVEANLGEEPRNLFMSLFQFYDQKQKDGNERATSVQENMEIIGAVMEEAEKLEQNNNIEGAVQAFEKAAKLSYEVFQAGGPGDINPSVMAGLKLMDLERFENAEIHLSHALQIIEAFEKLHDEQGIMVLKMLAMIYEILEEKEKSLAIQEKLFSAYEAVHGLNNEDTYSAMIKLYEMYIAADDIENTAAILVKIISVLEEVAGPDHEQTLQFKAMLEEIRNIEK